MPWNLQSLGSFLVTLPFPTPESLCGEKKLQKKFCHFIRNVSLPLWTSQGKFQNERTNYGRFASSPFRPKSFRPNSNSFRPNQGRFTPTQSRFAPTKSRSPRPKVDSPRPKSRSAEVSSYDLESNKWLTWTKQILLRPLNLLLWNTKRKNHTFLALGTSINNRLVVIKYLGRTIRKVIGGGTFSACKIFFSFFFNVHCLYGIFFFGVKSPARFFLLFLYVDFYGWLSDRRTVK